MTLPLSFVVTPGLVLDLLSSLLGPIETANPPAAMANGIEAFCSP